MTESPSYSERLQSLTSASWKRWLNVQAPYRWNVRRLCPGRVLDVGCGIGRNLSHLGGRGIGVDHNATSVEVARQQGLLAFMPADFLVSTHAAAGSFDTLLVAHVLEHLQSSEADALLRTYLPFVRGGGRIVMITPQERGWQTDETHVRWVGPAELTETSQRLGLAESRQFSFPFHRLAGRWFPYNEFVCVAHVRTEKSVTGPASP